MGIPEIRANTKKLRKPRKLPNPTPNSTENVVELRKTDNSMESAKLSGKPQKPKLLPTTTHNDKSPMGSYSNPHEPMKTKKSVGIQ